MGEVPLYDTCSVIGCERQVLYGPASGGKGSKGIN